MKRTRLFLLTAMLAAVMALVSIVPAMAQNETLLIWADGERTPILTELAETYEAEFGVTLEIREIGFGEARDELLNFGPAGEGPDLIILPHDSTGQLVENGAIVPIDLGDKAELFLPSALNLFTYRGELWGMPYSIENVALIRNTDLVPEAPATWEEVREISAELRDSGAAEYAFLVQTGDAYHNYPIISAFGGYIFGQNADGSFDVTDIGLGSEGGLAAAAWLEDMYANEYMVPNVDNDVIYSLFEEGELAMFITGPWFSERTTEAAEAGGFEYAISPLPGSEAGLEVGVPFSGGQGFLISAFSEKQLLAQQFLTEFIATAESMEALAQRIPVFAGVEVEDPNIDFFIEAGANAVPMPAIPEMQAVWAAAGDALTNISLGEEGVASMETAVEQINNAIELSQSEDLIVGLPGSLGVAAGCESDWNPACEATFFTAEGDGIYTLTVTLPAGDYEYKVAMNGTWDENYGLGGERDGANIPLSLSEETEVTFVWDNNAKTISDSVNGVRE